MSKTPEVPPLGDDNPFNEWAPQVDDLLILRDLADFRTRPPGAILGPAEQAADRKALAIIRLHCSKTSVTPIRDCATPAEAWEILQTIHAGESQTRPTARGVPDVSRG